MARSTSDLIREQRVIDTITSVAKGQATAWQRDFKQYMLSIAELPYGKWKTAVRRYALKTLTPLERKLLIQTIDTAARLPKAYPEKDVKGIPINKSRDIAARQTTLGKNAARLFGSWKVSAIVAITAEIVRLKGQSLSNIEIAHGVGGTSKNNYSDGITNATRNGAAAITNSEIVAGSEAIRAQSRDTQDGVQGYVWVSTLDGRTTQICQGLHGKKFFYYRVVNGKKVPLSGYKPLPPIHYNCRSKTEAIFQGEPAPDFGETFAQWAKNPDNDAQLLESMGRTRYNMYKAGEIKIERYTDARFNPLTLPELHAAGFDIDPI